MNDIDDETEYRHHPAVKVIFWVLVAFVVTLAVWAFTLPAQAAPQKYTATTDQTLAITWDAVAGADGYQYRWRLPDGKYTKPVTVTETSIEVPPPAVGEVRFHVRAFRNVTDDAGKEGVDRSKWATNSGAGWVLTVTEPTGDAAGEPPELQAPKNLSIQLIEALQSLAEALTESADQQRRLATELDRIGGEIQPVE